MKITSPLSRVEEIAPLLAAGADEFYCSVVPAEWRDSFGSSTTSRRPFGNLPEESDLARAVEEIHGAGKHISLVMNAQHYTSEQLDCLRALAARFAAMGGDALIIGDAALLALIAEEKLGIGLHVSSIAACRNRRSVGFFRDMGATRIIFPRDMTLAEMGRIAGRYPDMEFEAFVLNDGCVFEEGVCHTIHLPGQLGGAICMDNYAYRYQRVDGAPLSAREVAAFQHNDDRYAAWLWYRFGCGFSVTEEGYPFGPCGLCAMTDLRDMGLASVKIAGRDAPLTRKVKSVELVRRVRDEMAKSAPPRDMAAFARNIRRNPDLCGDGRMCYYPEVVRRGG